MRRIATVLAATLLALVALASPFVASAHESRDVGDYTFVVGFINEPALQDDTNGIRLSVEMGEEPVVGLFDTLRAQVLFGDQSREMTLTPAFGEDGAYEAVVIPTEPGDYTFRFFGQIEGLEVDETFTSSPEGFDPVLALSELEFPGSDESGSGGDVAVSVAMPLAAGGAVLIFAVMGYAVRRRAA
jgi:hypothetical protein